MSLPASLERLVEATDSLAEALAAARMTVCEDQPLGTATLAVDELAETIVELSGEAGTLRTVVRRTVLGPVPPSGEAALALVSLAQQALNDIVDCMAARVTACERQAEVHRAAVRGGPRWRAWWAASAHGLTECDRPLHVVRDALIGCWYELAAGEGRSVHVTPTTPIEEPGGGPDR